MITLVPIVLAQVALMAGGPVSVSCSASLPGEEAGYADWQARAIVVDNYVCRNALSFARRPVLSDSTEVWSDLTTSRAFSLLILAHEADHIKNPQHSEAQANCAGLRDVPRFARALGATRKASIRVRNLARSWIRDEEPAPYQSACTR